MKSRWAYLYTECKSCHSTLKPHKGNGLCTTCYYRQYQRKKPPNRRAKPQINERLEEAKDEGRQQVIDAIHNLLNPYGGSCSLWDGTIYLELQGKTLKAELDDV